MILKNRKIVSFAIISAVFLVIAFLLELLLGPSNLSWAVFSSASDKMQRTILLNLRLPRSLLVLTTGILLGGSGAVFQLFFRNPLAEPGIIGISSGATLGAVIATLLPFSFSLSLISSVNISAFIFALISGLFVTILTFTKSFKKSSVMILLCGTALGTFFSAISSILLLTCNKELHAIYSWILGSFNGRGWNEFYIILIPAIISIIIMIFIANPLDLLSCGEKSASSLGVQVNQLRILTLISGSLAISCCVCAGGTIGFVGLIAPHIVRKLISPKGKLLVPFSMIFGSILLLIADLIARIAIAPSELPAGVITSVLGVPFFIAICIQSNRD